MQLYQFLLLFTEMRVCYSRCIGERLSVICKTQRRVARVHVDTIPTYIVRYFTGNNATYINIKLRISYSYLLGGKRHGIRSHDGAKCSCLHTGCKVSDTRISLARFNVNKHAKRGKRQEPNFANVINIDVKRRQNIATFPAILTFVLLIPRCGQVPRNEQYCAVCLKMDYTLRCLEYICSVSLPLRRHRFSLRSPNIISNSCKHKYNTRILLQILLEEHHNVHVDLADNRNTIVITVALITGVREFNIQTTVI